MTILGIESSCDETAASLLSVEGKRFSLVSNVVASQVTIHAQYGGVVPEVAARNHITSILPVITKALRGTIPDVIAVTAGPGLITSLLVGVHTAKTVSYLWKKPLVAVNHIEGHVYANFMKQEIWSMKKGKLFPAVVLIVSGGHTELVLMKDHGKYVLLGATRDDAAGECYDKASAILGLGYPGGPAIDTMAHKGDSRRFPLPSPMIDTDDFEFSFSGLKTAVLYLVEKIKKEKKYNTQARADVCASFQKAVVDVLIKKTMRAVKKYKAQSVFLGGGVVANTELRQRMKGAFESDMSQTYCSYPDLRYCTDNAAIIAMDGASTARKIQYASWGTLEAMPQWELTER